jgi:hypothetical protein
MVGIGFPDTCDQNVGEFIALEPQLENIRVYSG